jgi:hypothetical protein
MRTLRLSLLLLLWALPVSARQITGTVTGPDGSPVSGATVFVHLTTLATQSGADGSFSLPAPPQYAFEVAAAANGFAPTGLQANQAAHTGLTLQLGGEQTPEGSPPDATLLEEFKITAFSYTRFASDIVIENPDVLRISRDASMGTLDVQATAPFVFTNPALGYRVTIHGLRLGGNAVAYGWNGWTQFEPLTPEKSKDEKTWASNRETTYEGSRRHFFSALMAGEMKKQEWGAWFVGGPGAAEDHSPVLEADLKSVYGDPQPILFSDDRPGVGRVDWAGWLRIKYFGDGGDSRWPRFIDRFWPVSDLSEVLASEMHVSFVELPTFQAFVDASGVLLPSERPATQVLGYWTFHRLADMLPNDWMP